MMRVGDTIRPNLVVAARAGDRQAVDDLVAASLPLVYTIVRQALGDDPDTDDVVQDVMIRALRQLPTLRKPESFRPWLTAIAVNQVGTHLHRRATGAGRTTPLDEAVAVPDPGAAIEDLTMLQLELSAQRRQIVRAGYWLDPDDRVLLSLWLLEVAGELSRAELAEALATSVAHAGVRIQRMRRQLEASRELVAALDARPRCPELDAAAADWDGTPSPLWRKRLIRHTRSCPVCAGPASTIVPPERLLTGSALLPAPIGLTAAVLGNTGGLAASSTAAAGVSGVSAGVKAGLLGQLLQSVVAHPIAASVAAGALAAGAAVTVTSLPATTPQSPRTIASPAVTGPARATPSAARPVTSAPRPTAAATARTQPAGPVTLAPGKPVSVESADEPGTFVTTADDLGVLVPVTSAGDYPVRRQATFTVLAGLADPGCFSFRAADGRYLRHSSWRLRLDGDQGTPLFRGDSTFCTGRGATAGTVTLESANYPGWFVHHRGRQLWVDQTDGSTAFRTQASFRLRAALAG
jgi:RNA polymerase sigma factor (sigma-70 family)